MLNKKTFILCIVTIFCTTALFTGCAKDRHWGQDLDKDKKWWTKEGQSWDRKEKIFMAIGNSNPDWDDRFDLRKSADLNARAEIANFMQSLTKNYMQEIRNSNYAISENMVESSSEETIIGSVVVARRYEKKNKNYKSLIKVDLKYFFEQIYNKFRKENATKLRVANRNLSDQELEEKINQNTEQTIINLKKLEDPVIEKTIKEEGE